MYGGKLMMNARKIELSLHTCKFYIVANAQLKRQSEWTMYVNQAWIDIYLYICNCILNHPLINQLKSGAEFFGNHRCRIWQVPNLTSAEFALSVDAEFEGAELSCTLCDLIQDKTRGPWATSLTWKNSSNQ